jgi:hypothetical protein
LLIGDRIGLHPVAVIFAIMAGGQLFGFIGVLLALPVAAVLMVLLRHFYRRYQDSEVYVGADSGPQVVLPDGVVIADHEVAGTEATERVESGTVVVAPKPSSS